MTELRLAGLDLTDASSRLLVRYVPHLTRLDLSQCGNVTDQTVHTLTSPISPLRESLTHVNLAGKCNRIRLKVQTPSVMSDSDPSEPDLFYTSAPTVVVVVTVVQVLYRCRTDQVFYRCSTVQV